MTDALQPGPSPRRTLTVISLGAGVQSTCMAMMAAHGEILPMPDCAIFADTGDEPAAVYEHLKWLMSGNVLPFPVRIVSAGRLSSALRAGDDHARVPFYLPGSGPTRRQCTSNFKIAPIRRETRVALGKGPRSHVAVGSVEQWIGISTDEAIRKKPSGVEFIVNRHPLIEKWMSREDCKSWLRGHGYDVPPKSSCVFCPYQRNAAWRNHRERPAQWATIVAMDDWLAEPSQVARFRGRLFVHSSCRPIREADLGESDLPLFGGDFAHECEGMCGV